MQKFCRTRIKDFTDYETLIVAGIPYEEILRKADDEKVSLIVWDPGPQRDRPLPVRQHSRASGQERQMSSDDHTPCLSDSI